MYVHVLNTERYFYKGHQIHSHIFRYNIAILIIILMLTSVPYLPATQNKNVLAWGMLLQFGHNWIKSANLCFLWTKIFTWWRLFLYFSDEQLMFLSYLPDFSDTAWKCTDSASLFSVMVNKECFSAWIILLTQLTQRSSSSVVFSFRKCQSKT